MSDLIGATLGDYRIEAVLGQGKIGRVFRGSHVYLRTPVALKIIDERFTSSPGFKARFVRHGQAIAGINHPHVVKVYHLGEQDGRSYVVMELVAGGSLAGHVPNPSATAWSPSNWRAIDLLRQATDGVAAVHARGLAHGDLKLSDVLVSKDDAGTTRVKVCDFGMLRLVNAKGDDSPEGQAEDLRALGDLLYELATGRAPSALAGAGVGAAGSARVAIPSPHEVLPGVPSELEAIILQCLATDPKGRFASCAELSKALGVAIEASGFRPQDAAPSVAPPVIPPVAPQAQPRPVVRRNTNPPKPPGPPASGAPKVPCVHVFDEGGNPVDMQYVRAAGITIGRSPDNGIVLPADDVAPRHTRIDWDARRVTVTDLGSPTSTFLQRHRLLPQVAQEWGQEQWLQVGGYWLWLQTPSTDPAAANVTEIMLDQQSKSMTITPGKASVCRVVLVNQKTQVDHVLLSVEGIPDEWIEGTKRDTQLQPFEKREVALAINVPKSSAGRAGDYTVTIRARSAANPDAEPGSVTAHWTVLPFEAMAVSIAPARSGGRTQARYTVTLHHDGNKPASYVLTGNDDEKRLECLFSTEGNLDRNRLQVDVDPGTKTNVKLKVAAPKRWFGSAVPYSFSVQAVPGEGRQGLTTDAQFTHRPIFPVWMLAVAPLVLIAILLSAPAFLKPVVSTVYVQPRNPTAGQKIEVFWEAPKATKIKLLVNELPVLPDPDVAQGKYVFTEGFEKDTRVRVLAANVFGEAAREVTVTVKPPPPPLPAALATVELSVRPAVITPGQEVTIRWHASGASRTDFSLLGSVPMESSAVDHPEADQTYTLTAFNADNVETKKSVTVKVRKPQVTSPGQLAFTASSPNAKKDAEGLVVGVGQTVIFQWEARNAQSARIDAISPVSLEGASGQKTAQLKGEGTYSFTLVATNQKGEEIRSKSILVQASCKSVPARVVTFRFGCNKNPEVVWK